MSAALSRHKRPNRLVTNDAESKKWLAEYAAARNIPLQEAVREAVQAGVTVLKLATAEPSPAAAEASE